MAHPMSGRDSAPIARSNDPVSIFAREKKMPKQTNKPAPVETPATVEPEPVAAPEPEPVQSVASDDLAYLRAQKKALDEQIKAAKAANKAGKKVSATVPESAMRYPLSRITARVKGGQEQEEAIRDTFALFENVVRQTLKTSSTE
jgi:hypothetical protein